LQRRSSSSLNLNTPQSSPEDFDAASKNSLDRTIFISWKKQRRKKLDEEKGSVRNVHTEDSLKLVFGVYGRIAHITVKERKALIVFTHKYEAAAAVEKRLHHEGFKISLPGEKKKKISGTTNSEDKKESQSQPLFTEQIPKFNHVPPSKVENSQKKPEIIRSRSSDNHEDYENQTMMRLQQFIHLQKQPSQGTLVT